MKFERKKKKFVQCYVDNSSVQQSQSEDSGSNPDPIIRSTGSFSACDSIGYIDGNPFYTNVNL